MWGNPQHIFQLLYDVNKRRDGTILGPADLCALDLLFGISLFISSQTASRRQLATDSTSQIPSVGECNRFQLFIIYWYAK